MREVQAEAKTVQNAVDKALAEIGLRRDQVEVVIKQEGSSGFLGIGAKPAIVTVREKKWSHGEAEGDADDRQRPRQRRGGAGPRERGGRQEGRGGRGGRGERRDSRPRRQDGFYAVNSAGFERIPLSAISAKKQDEPEQAEGTEPQPQQAELPPVEYQPVPQQLEQSAEQAKTALLEILSKIGVKADNIKLGWDGVQSRIMLDFDCDSPETVIGGDGKTIESLQYIIVLMISRRSNSPIAVQIDTAGYWRRLEAGLVAGVNRGVKEVERSGRPYRMQPMSAATRRFVHKMLSGHPNVETCSEGEGRWRKVILKPRQKNAQPA
ncbi:MAG: Jag N-terminal domain-containing protein [Elusimicrobiales bacterium]